MWPLPDFLILFRYFSRQANRYLLNGMIKMEEIKHEIQQKGGQIS